MKVMARNRQKFFYCLRDEDEALTETDEYGNVIETGEKKASFKEPVAMKAIISEGTTRASLETFGFLENYSKVLTTDEMDCPIEVGTVLFIEREPVFENNLPLYDHIVVGKSHSLNVINYAIDRVEIS